MEAFTLRTCGKSMRGETLPPPTAKRCLSTVCLSGPLIPAGQPTLNAFFPSLAHCELSQSACAFLVSLEILHPR